MLTTALNTIFRFLLFTGLVWLIIHFLSFFGLFLTIGYFVGFFLVPTRLPCLFCFTNKDGSYCPFCKKNVNKTLGTSPNSFRSAILNSFVLLSLSIISVGFIFVESRVLGKLGVVTVKRTVEYELQGDAQYKVGQLFAVVITADNIQTDVNAFQADLQFDPSIVEAVKIDTQNSFATIIVQKEIDNKLGYIRFNGGIPNPGYKNPEAHVGTVYFRGKAPGATVITFLPTSLVLANDGHGTNVLKSYAKKSYLILPTHPDEIFPEIRHIFENLPQNNTETRIDFSETKSTPDNQSTLSASTPSANNATKTEKFSPLAWLGTLNTFILDLWRLK